MGDFIPEKLQFPYFKKNENIPDVKKPSENEKARINNLALENICIVNKITGPE